MVLQEGGIVWFRILHDLFSQIKMQKYLWNVMDIALALCLNNAIVLKLAQSAQMIYVYRY